MMIGSFILASNCSDSCLLSPDVILVHDGVNSSATVIGQLCNSDSFVELSSSDQQMHVQFVSKSLFPGQGFRASYVFEDIPPVAFLLAPSTALSGSEAVAASGTGKEGEAGAGK